LSVLGTNVSAPVGSNGSDNLSLPMGSLPISTPSRTEDNSDLGNLDLNHQPHRGLEGIGVGTPRGGHGGNGRDGNGHGRDGNGHGRDGNGHGHDGDHGHDNGNGGNDPNPTPEPGSMLLLGGALAAGMRRFRKR
jgi:PEP-CTERM motif